MHVNVISILSQITIPVIYSHALLKRGMRDKAFLKSRETGLQLFEYLHTVS